MEEEEEEEEEEEVSPEDEDEDEDEDEEGMEALEAVVNDGDGGAPPSVLVVLTWVFRPLEPPRDPRGPASSPTSILVVIVIVAVATAATAATAANFLHLASRRIVQQSLFCHTSRLMSALILGNRGFRTRIFAARIVAALCNTHG